MAMPPVYTLLITARLARPGAPTAHDRRVMADALDAIEDAYPFSPRD